jgi:hypothetical protein
MQPQLLFGYLPRALYALLALAFVWSFLLTLWMVFYFPVYTDEIFWKLMIARLETDHGKLVYLFAQCSEGQWIDAPLTWYPAMLINSWLYEDASHPWRLRVHGWFFFLVLLALWTWLLKRRAGLEVTGAFLAVSAFLSVGVLPFLLVYARPEQPLLLLITLSLLLTLYKAPAKRLSWPIGLLAFLSFALVATLLAAIHPKGMFLFPVLLVLAWRQLKSWPLLVLLVLILGWTAYDTSQVWQLRTTCPEFPGLMSTLKGLTLQPSVLLSKPLTFIQQGWSNVLDFGVYVRSLNFQDQYFVDWLPARKGGVMSSQASSVANLLLWIPLLVAVLVIALNWIYDRRPRGRVDLLLWFSILLSLASIVILQKQKNFYEVSIVWPLLLLIVIFSFGRPVSESNRGGVRIIIAVLMLVALLSGILREERFGEFVPDWRQARLQQVEMIDHQNQGLRDFARKECGIKSNAQRLVLDKDTFQAFWHHEQPIFLDYASGWWAAESNVRDTFRKRRVQGLVGLCTNIPEADRPRAIEFGSYCCMSADALR